MKIDHINLLYTFPNASMSGVGYDHETLQLHVNTATFSQVLRHQKATWRLDNKRETCSEVSASDISI